jgi:hypothetical protein
LTAGLAVRRAPLRLVCAGSLAVAALSLLLPSTLTYDPWTWMLWGREVASLSLDTSVGPAFKPLPVLVGFVLSPLGDAAPWVWLVLARAGALLASVMAWRLASRLCGGSVLAGALALGCVLVCGGFVWNGALGNAEGLMLGLVLVAFERALDGRHRGALLLALLVALLRTEAVPFVALYAAWVWRRDAGARPWIAAGAAALPLAWLGPDLIATGDAFRSSERARIPNPGAPALADRPALDSFARALALAPTLVWAGAALAALGAARRELPRAAALPAAAGIAWMALIAAMAELGYSGEERYALPGVALAAVSAGAGIGWAADRFASYRRYSNGKTQNALVGGAIGLVLLSVAGAEQAGAFREDLRDLRYEARVYGDLERAVERAGPRCGPVHTAPLTRPALAWRLKAPISALSTETATKGTAFRARPYRGAPLGPAVKQGASPLVPRGPEWREVARAGEWQVVTRCG